MYPPSRDVIQTIEQQYERINNVFISINNTLKEINSGIDTLNTTDLASFVDNFEKLSSPLGEYWTGELSGNNILLIIRDILNKGDALKDFANVIAHTEAKIKKAADEAKKLADAKKELDGGGSGGNGGNGGNGGGSDGGNIGDIVE